jgi:hypothetical protein
MEDLIEPQAGRVRREQHRLELRIRGVGNQPLDFLATQEDRQFARAA